MVLQTMEHSERLCRCWQWHCTRRFQDRQWQDTGSVSEVPAPCQALVLNGVPGPHSSPTRPNLRDDGDLEAQVVQADLGNVDAVNNNLSLGGLVDPE